MPSFDVVSQVDLAELDNALAQAKKELETRYDFKGANASLEKQPGNAVQFKASSEEHVNGLREMLFQKLARRGISLRNVELGRVEESGVKLYKQLMTVKEGIAPEKLKKLTALVKESKLKAQPAIQGDTLRVSAKKRDDLQDVIALLRGKADELDLSLQFINFRD